LIWDQHTHFDGVIESRSRNEACPFEREYNGLNWRRADPEMLPQVGRRPAVQLRAGVDEREILAAWA
jgi:hypothetical protein